ncbi:hypothetical protein, partial [Kocuria sp.]|uniref:hypothetical protein n=1 Tax=Kocuria sp. TaxID=1871328 RepID=UPI0028974A62
MSRFGARGAPASGLISSSRLAVAALPLRGVSVGTAHIGAALILTVPALPLRGVSVGTAHIGAAL